MDQTDFAVEKIEISDVKPESTKYPKKELTDEDKSTLRKVAGKIRWLARGTRLDLVFIKWR